VDKDIEVLVPEDKFLSIGKKKFKIWISAERSLMATVLFNKISAKTTDEHKAILTDYDFYSAMLDVAFILIKQDFSIFNIFDWIRRELLTKKYILKHLDIKELASFVDDALEPIIGTKKKRDEETGKGSGGHDGSDGVDQPRSISGIIAEFITGCGYTKSYVMKKLTIEEIVFLWSAKYKYDHLLHGFKFEEKITDEKANKKLNGLKGLYGDLL